jgi:hypothetical protein
MDSLPPLGGGLLAAYRLSWWLMLASALGVVALSWIDAVAAPEILVLRLAKSAVLITVSAILFRRRSRDAIAAMLSLAFLLWTISSSSDFADASAWPTVLDRLRFLLFALALLLFPDGHWQPAWTRPLAGLITATFLLGVAEASGLVASKLYLPIAIACVLAALAALVARYRGLGPGTQKQQLKWVTLGLCGGISLILFARAGVALTSELAMPAIGALMLEALFQSGIMLLAVGFLISLLRYRLYDAEAAISRSAVYAALTLMLVGTFAASEALIELLGQRLFGMAIGNVSGAIAAAVAAMMLTPLHGRINRWAEQHFQHDLATLKSELPDLLAVLSSSASVKQLARAVLPHIEQGVHATRMALLVNGKLVGAHGISSAGANGLLRCWNPPESVELLSRDDEDPFPLRMALRCPLGSIRGWLLLGPRPDGSFYGRDDLEALTEIVRPLQRTLVLVAEREAEVARHRDIIRGLHRSMAALSDRLDHVEQLTVMGSISRKKSTSKAQAI